MKKLSFKKIDVNQEDILQKRELKQVMGGYGAQTYFCRCVSTSAGTYFSAMSLGDAYAQASMELRCYNRDYDVQENLVCESLVW